MKPSVLPGEGLADTAGVTFDFYGTVATHRTGRGRGSTLIDYLRSLGLDPAPWQHEILYELFASHHLEYTDQLTPGEKSAYLTRFAERVLCRLTGHAARGLDPDEVGTIWSILGPAAFSIYPETGRVLSRLRGSGYRTAVVSNWHCGLGSFCAELGVGALVDDVVASAEVGAAKPDARIFLEAARRLGLPPERMLHVGDTPDEDVAGARAAGLRALLLVRKDQPASEHGATIRDLDGVLACLGLT